MTRVSHLKYVRLEERYEQHGERDQLTDVLKPAQNSNTPVNNIQLSGQKINVKK